MRQANAAMVAFLATRRSFTKADLFTITLIDGTVYALTSYDRDLMVSPYLFSARGPLIDRTKWAVKNTIDVPEMGMTIKSNGYDMPDGSNLKLAVHNGLFDYATVLLSRVIMPTPGDTSLGAVDLFAGSIAELDIDALSITMTVKGLNAQLEQYAPKNQYHNSCIHSLFDAGCAPDPGMPGGGPTRAAFTVANSVGAGSTKYFINWGSAVPANPTQFSLGYVTFTSGANVGRTVTIPGGSASATGFGLAYPLYVAPAVGDTFNVTYGCPRNRGASGCQFFANTQHFRGFRWIPPAEFGV